MKIKHLLLISLIGFIIYLDYLWYCFACSLHTANVLGAWYFINAAVFIIFLAVYLHYLHVETMFFENFNRILNKKIF